jgi:hypothetical protein
MHTKHAIFRVQTSRTTLHDTRELTCYWIEYLAGWFPLGIQYSGMINADGNRVELITRILSAREWIITMLFLIKQTKTFSVSDQTNENFFCFWSNEQKFLIKRTKTSDQTNENSRSNERQLLIKQTKTSDPTNKNFWSNERKQTFEDNSEIVTSIEF